MYEVTVIGERGDRQQQQQQQLAPEERTLVARLAVREREVRATEMRRQADAGTLAAGIEYVYERGPDGRMRATGGRMRTLVPPARFPGEAQVRLYPLRVAAPAAARPSEAVRLQQLSPERIESLGDLPGVCSFTSFGGLNRTA